MRGFPLPWVVALLGMIGFGSASAMAFPPMQASAPVGRGSSESTDSATLLQQRAGGSGTRSSARFAAAPPSWRPLASEEDVESADLQRLFPRRWAWSMTGDGIGSSGLEVRDLDADGVPEIVVTAGVDPFSAASYWYILRWSGSQYEQTWASSQYPNAVAAIDIAQADADSPLEVLVASGQVVQVYDGSSKQLQGAFSSSTSDPKDIAAGDIDADGRIELVVIDASDLFVFDLESGALEAIRFGFGGKAVALGQADLDPALEIAVAAGDLPGSVLDGATLLVQWGRSAGLGSLVRFADTDGDPTEELVAGWLVNEGIRVFDFPSGNEIYHLPISVLSDFRISNVDTDPSMEILFGGGDLSALHVVSAVTGVEEWSLRGATRGVDSLAIGDVDVDGVDEILWGAGRSSTGKDVLFVADSRAHAIEWESRDLRGPFRALTAFDREGDGVPALLAGSFLSDGGSREGVVSRFDLLREQVLPFANPVPQFYGRGLWRIRSENLDLDPQDELCISTATAQTEGVTCLDGLSQEVAWRVSWPWGSAVSSLAIVDVDGDQQLEVVAGARSLPGGQGLFVYCYRAESGWLEWRTPDLSGYLGELSLLRVGNIDNDPTPEVVVADFQHRLFVIDGVTGLVESGPFDLAVSALDLADRVGDPASEIYVGLADGTVRQLDPATGDTVVILPSLGSPVDALAIAQFGEGPVDDFVVSASGAIRVFDGSLGTEIWSSGRVASAVGTRDSLLAVDLDSDGKRDLVADTGMGVVAFLTRFDTNTIYVSGFESGETSWSSPRGVAP